MELVVISPVLGDVGELELVEVICDEVSLHEVLVNGRAGSLPTPPSFLPEDRPPLVVSADLPSSLLTHRLAGLVGFCGEEPGSELGVMAVGVEQGVPAVYLDELRGGDWVLQPPIVGLAGELRDPQGHRDGNPVDGDLFHERVEPLDGWFTWDRYAAARRAALMTPRGSFRHGYRPRHRLGAATCWGLSRERRSSERSA